MEIVRPQIEYPADLEQIKGTPDSRITRFRNAYALHGSGDIDALFRGHVSTGVPFPTVGRMKGRPFYDQSAVRQTLQSPPQLEEIDSRHLFATQPSVTRPGVSYYMGDDYQKTGRTYADQGNVGNQYPVVYTDRQGQNIILSGHHRASAALISGQFLQARRVRGDV